MNKSIIPGIYTHYKNGNLYKVFGIALHTETSENMVLYTSFDCKDPYKKSNTLYVRPLDMFCGRVNHEGRDVERFVRSDISEKRMCYIYDMLNIIEDNICGHIKGAHRQYKWKK